MQVHEVRPSKKKHVARRIGRGGKRGTYSGRGMKGQKSRAGGRMQPRIRELFKRYPKVRGHRRSRGAKVTSINLAVLEKYFAKGETVSPRVLAQKRITGTIKKRLSAVKILGNGEITKALTIEKCAVSDAAKTKIEKAGGTVQ